MFTPLHTDRLSIRPFRADDADGLAERRNHPEVARYQNYTLPYSREQAGQLVEGVLAMEGPANEQWWAAAVDERATGRVLGDLALRLSWEGRTAEVGYTFGPAHWGRGYATEALQALVDWLFEKRHVTRVFGMLHPDNVASAMVLERCGFQFEGHTRSSFWVGEECSDDWIYGLTGPDREVWRRRRRHPPQDVRLQEVTAGNVGAVSALRLHKTQEAFTGPVARWFTDALYPEAVDGHPVDARPRALIADGEVVGLAAVTSRTARHPEPILQRLLVDRLHQRRGIGGRALDLLAAECRAAGARTLLTTWGEGRGSPRPFLLRHGFEPTGRSIGGRTEGRWHLL